MDYNINIKHKEVSPMAMVVARKEETVDSLYKRFKKKVANDGILIDLRKTEYYVPKSEKKRIKHEMALKRQRIAEKKKRKHD